MHDKYLWAVSAMNSTALALDENASLIVEVLQTAKLKGIDFIALPSFALTGIGAGDAFFQEQLEARAWGLLSKKILPETAGLTVAMGMPFSYEGRLYEGALLMGKQEILGLSLRTAAFQERPLGLQRWFSLWEKGRRVEISHHGHEFWAGELTYAFGARRLSLHLGGLGAFEAENEVSPGAEVRVFLDGEPFKLGGEDVEKALEEKACHGPVLRSNLLGCESGRVLYDGHAWIADGPSIISESKAFSFQDWTLALAELPWEEGLAGAEKESFLSLEPVLPCLESEAHSGFERGSLPSRELQVDANELLTLALTRGLWDYMRKSHSRGFVLSFSGGADSAMCGVLVAYMLRQAYLELGQKGLEEKLGRGKGYDFSSPMALTKSLLLTLYQGTVNSSSQTRKAARGLGKALGSEHHEIDIDRLVKGYEAMAEGVLGRSLTWEEDDIARQNIQARTRAPGAWLLANVRRALLLVTGNRSELLVGYSTMDGDSAGGLCPLGGLSKTAILAWLHWAKDVGPKGIGPIPELSLILSQRPSAELRPPKDAQKDEEDLMPYPVLDRIEQHFLMEQKGQDECLEALKRELKGKYEDAQLELWVGRFFRLWKQNQWKRERNAPSFYLGEPDISPATGTRYPILSGQGT